MQATVKVTEKYNVTMQDSGANVLKSAFRFSKTIGKAVAAKEGLSGDEAAVRAGEIQRALRRVRVALETPEYVD